MKNPQIIGIRKFFIAKIKMYACFQYFEGEKCLTPVSAAMQHPLLSVASLWNLRVIDSGATESGQSFYDVLEVKSTKYKLLRKKP